MINDYALENGCTFLEVLTQAVKSFIEQNNKKSLSGALNKYADPSKIILEKQAWYMSVSDE